MGLLSRCIFLIAALATLAGCSMFRSDMSPVSSPRVQNVPEEVRALYGPVTNEPYALPAVDIAAIDPKFWRQQVDYDTIYPAGTLVVDTNARFLYLVGENGKALRYGIGVGKEGLAFEGEGTIQYKRRWPNWAPTEAMMAREPERYGHLAQGMPPGPDNPLGARALYLFKNGKDTLFRIHGSHEAWSIGHAMSSGCIRLLNQDIIDLYGRVPKGSRVVVLQNGEDAFSMPDTRSVVSRGDKWALSAPDSKSADSQGARRAPSAPDSKSADSQGARWALSAPDSKSADSQGARWASSAPDSKSLASQDARQASSKSRYRPAMNRRQPDVSSDDLF
ncbi:ErfK/YbiS/YcfS/YnhG family protein [Bartonella australis AUST/NH1]|uniref:ErfK/YbiS/YcfS/YnhG family protein n=1 Tax=Bartonella australis (strain Aust/NH1) TaxID=1094489 RepID=M1NTX7_BARAA|nr:ErfK/YbiS/YcfS/YnhG family protein [Bartonella australis AUST/NH1]